MMWASVIVSSDSRAPSWVKSRKADTPATISGVTSGTSMRMFALVAKRERARTSPNASSVPSTVPTIIVTNAISRLAISDPRSDSFSKNARYHSRLSPSIRCSERCELNENTTTSTIGANRNTKKIPM